MSRLDVLLSRFSTHLDLPWQASSPRVWIVVYDKGDERRLRARLDAFATAARQRSLAWSAVDMTTVVSTWLGEHDYAESYFEHPDLLEAEIGDLQDVAEARVVTALSAASPSGPDAMVAVYGTGGLFGYASVPDLIRAVETEVTGRLVVFFPGSVERGRYRLLDGSDGWDYRALAITADL